MISAKASGDDWSIQTQEHSQDGVNAKTQQRKQDETEQIDSTITVLSGRSAYVALEKKIPYTQKENTTKPDTPVERSVYFEKAETGLEVRPTVVGNNVRIEIEPRVSDTKGRIIHITKASTVLVVPRGKWITVWENRLKTDEAIRKHLSKGKEAHDTVPWFSLFVEP